MGRRRLQQQLDLFLHSPPVEMGLVVLILTWTTLVVADFLTRQPPHPNLLVVLAEIPLRLCFTG